MVCISFKKEEKKCLGRKKDEAPPLNIRFKWENKVRKLN